LRITLLFSALCVALAASCGGEKPPVEEYVQDPLATAAETPDVTEPLGRPADDPAAAVEAFLLAVRLGDGERMRGMVCPVGDGAPLAARLEGLAAESDMTDWGEITVSPGPAVEGELIESRTVAVRVHRGETSRLWRFTVVRTNAGWYLWDLAG